MLGWSCMGVLSVVLVAPDGGEIRGNAFVEVTNQLGPGVNIPDQGGVGQDGSPYLSPDGSVLVFTSWGRMEGLGNFDLYIAKRTGGSGPFVEVENVGAPVNTAADEAYPCISADLETLLFVRGGSDEWNNTIFIARRDEPTARFSAPSQLPNVRGELEWSSDLLPCLSVDERELWFSSIRPSGQTQFDIWVSTRPSPQDEFEPPMLLEEYLPGSVVNSAYNEIGVSLAADGLALVFSDGMLEPLRPGAPGRGNGDLWLSTRGDAGAPFGEPVNLNDLSLRPVNTEAMEVYPTIARTWPARGAELYFESYRNGNLDIWRAVWEAVPEPSLTVEGPDASCAVTVDASASTSPEGTMPLEFRWDFGDGVTGEWSEAGDWAKVSHTYAAPGRFLIALTVVNALGVESTATAIATIPCSCAPGGDVAPWTAEDVGVPIFPGSSWMDGDDLEVCAGGRGFGGSADELHFVHQVVSGDFVLTVEVAEVADWGASGGSVGLMARDGLEPAARHASVLLERTTSVRHRFRYREEPDDVGRGRAGTPTETPRWLRLERCGDLFVARSSADGSAWEAVDRQEIPGMPEELLVGVAATGRDSGDPTRAFTPLRARLSGLSTVPPTTSSRFVRGEANRDGEVDLSDAVAILGYLFLGGSLECLDAADVDDDGAVVITDAIALLNFLFLGGPAPAAPYPDPGADPTEDELGCVASSGCE